VIRRALVLAVLALLAAPAAASAHATLLGTVPERGAMVQREPAQVEFRFDEPVEAAFGALRVFDSAGGQVQTGAAFHPGGRGDVVAVKLAPRLPHGSYTATYRVISADGHPVSSGFVFSIGHAGAAGTSVDALLAGEGASGPVTSTAFAVVRAVEYGAIALGLGALAFLLICWLPGLRLVAGGGGEWQAASDAFASRTQRIIVAACVAGLLSSLAALALQGAVGQGSTFWAALKPDVVREVLGTRFGTAWGLAAAAWALALLALSVQRPLPRLQPASVGATGLALPGARVAAPAVPLVALALLPAMGGHASVQPPVGLLLPANVLHVLAMSAWLGGIAVLVFALRAATRALAVENRARLLAAVVSRFSTLAGIAIAVLLATGVVQGIVEVRTFPHLIDTAFGRAVLIKVVVAAGIVALGYVNRQRLLPALRTATTPGRAGVLLRSTLRAEFVLGVVALAATGALSTYAPSTAVSSGPYATTTTLGPIRLEVTVDPARVGPNELHLYLFDRRTGAPFAGTKELTVTAAQPDKGIAPITLTPHVAGPGHFVVEGATLGVKGKWTISVTDRVSDFDEYETRFTTPIGT
jgi:copper transport protein